MLLLHSMHGTPLVVAVAVSAVAVRVAAVVAVV